MSPDGMHLWVLWEIDDDIVRPFLIIFGLEVLPEDQRKANVTPIFKKGKKEDTENSRLVRLNSICWKVME